MDAVDRRLVACACASCLGGEGRGLGGLRGARAALTRPGNNMPQAAPWRRPLVGELEVLLGPPPTSGQVVVMGSPLIGQRQRECAP